MTKALNRNNMQIYRLQKQLMSCSYITYGLKIFNTIESNRIVQQNNAENNTDKIEQKNEITSHWRKL